ncbi:hypothetical protein BMS3Abin11_02013 [bacterium BMS3Abin11]|nr:hypothetical protein BMS3Abin11_02013 [bacterium BMS3Abin11]GMT40819.1 MAG: hypothetical protein IEMM0001_1554 [bacterium]
MRISNARHKLTSRAIFTLLILALSSLGNPLLAQVNTLGKPKIMIIMQEKVMGVFGTTGWESPGQVEITLAEKFRALGYPVMDPNTVRRNVKQSVALRMLEGDNASAAAEANKMGAQITIIGTAISKPGGAKLYGTQMQSIQATITARVVQNDDARIIASGTATASKVHIDEVQGGVLALEEAATELAEKLIPMINAKVDKTQYGEGNLLTLNISNLQHYPHLDLILYFFETSVDGVSQVYMRDYKNSVADIGLMYSGQSTELARKISEATFPGFSLLATNVTANRMDLVVVLK